MELLFLIEALFVFIKPVSLLELKSHTACYGNQRQHYVNASCPGEQKIAVRGFTTLAKYKSLGCPKEQTTQNDTACCHYDQNDCSEPYTAVSFYEKCFGKSSCEVQAERVKLPPHCNQSVFMESTNYMKLDYYCISDQAVDPCTDLTISDSPTFFWYPLNMTTTSTSCTCSIETSCDTTVELTALNLQLIDDGDCKQSIVIIDGSSQTTFDCSNNSNFLPRLIYTSSGHFLTMTFINNRSVSGGNVSIQVQGSNPTGEVTLSCGESALTMPSRNPNSLPTCPDKDSSNVSPELTTKLWKKNSTITDDKHDEQNNDLKIWIGIVIGIVIPTIIGIIMFVCRKKLKDCCQRNRPIINTKEMTRL